MRACRHPCPSPDSRAERIAPALQQLQQVRADVATGDRDALRRLRYDGAVNNRHLQRPNSTSN
eukprot:259810-Chlamydomonas_euryale.AAC.10